MTPQSMVVGNGFCTAPLIPQLSEGLFVSQLASVGCAHHAAAKLRPGQYLCAPHLGPWTAFALWDVSAAAASLGLYDSGVAQIHVRSQLDATLALGAEIPTLRFAVVGSPDNVSLPRVWGLLERRLGPNPLPEPNPADAGSAPANVFAGERTYVVFNGASDWLGEPSSV